jgi:integration host factor subunit beta
VPHFKPGKELRDRVNQAYQEELARLEQGESDSDDEDGVSVSTRAAASVG